MNCKYCQKEITEEEIAKYDCDECHEVHVLVICDNCKKGFEI